MSGVVAGSPPPPSLASGSRLKPANGQSRKIGAQLTPRCCSETETGNGYTAPHGKLVFSRGEVAEWSIAAVSKTVDPLRGPEVRILSSPPVLSQIATMATQNSIHVSDTLP